MRHLIHNNAQCLHKRTFPSLTMSAERISWRCFPRNRQTTVNPIMHESTITSTQSRHGGLFSLADEPSFRLDLWSQRIQFGSSRFIGLFHNVSNPQIIYTSKNPQGSDKRNFTVHTQLYQVAIDKSGTKGTEKVCLVRPKQCRKVLLSRIHTFQSIN